ncbi:TlpA disulfide reductase family protein [Haliscomenobacter sp.]|uniref:TlpA family protein disulfide reductase n=1 Tax=Haliscomenobacter sp. TaxID=2717303 RepID=UPI00336501D9
MKNVSLFVLLLTAQVCLWSQSKTIVVHTFPEIGLHHYFSLWNFEPNYLPSTDSLAKKLQGIPTYLKDYGVALFIYPDQQKIKEDIRKTFKNNEARADSLIRKLKYFNLMVVGYDKSDKVIIIDSDNNYDLSNDFVVRFPLARKEDNQQQYSTLNYQSFDQGKIQWKSSNVMIHAFNSWIIKTIPERYDMWISPFGTVYKGSFKIGDQVYNLALNNAPERFDNMDLLIKPNGLNLAENNPLSAFLPKMDTFQLAQKSYHIKYIAPDVDTLIIEETPPKKYRGIVSGALMPDLKYPNLKDKIVSTSSYRGKFLLIDLWGSWCGPCIAQMPKLKLLHEKYRSKNFAILGLAFEIDKTLNNLKAAVLEQGLPWDQLYTTEPLKVFFSNHAIFPTYVIVAPDGTILAREGPEGFSKIEAQLEKALK